MSLPDGGVIHAKAASEASAAPGASGDQDAIEILMRAGYAARGAVYLTVGVLALYAAFGGGQAKGSSGALETLAAQPFGQIMLAFIAAGLFAYAAWRAADAFLDLENEGDDAEGFASRAGQFMSGATHAFLGATAGAILWKGSQDSGSGSGGSSTENWTATIMSEPLGRWLVAIAGLITLGVGVYMFIKAWRAKHKEKIRNTSFTEKFAPAIRFGVLAHGAVLLIIGGLIAFAGFTADPEKAAGLGEALRIIEAQPFGRTLLGLAGAGMIGFALYCAVMAVYRIAPSVQNTGEVKTLAA